MESRPRGLGASGPTKSGRERAVALSRRLRRVLRGLYLERGRPGDDVLVLDGLDPSTPEAVVADFADALRGYRITRAHGDRYGAAWVAEQFQKQRIRYEASEGW